MAEPPVARALVCETSDLVRMGLLAALADGGFDAIACPLSRVGASVARGGPVVVLAGTDQLAAVRAALTGCEPEPPIVAVTASDSAADCHEALRLGAAGAVARTAPADLVVDIVRHALRGETLLPTAVARTAVRESARPRCECNGLDEVERALVRWTAQGVTVATIASRLHRSERDCYRLLRRLWRKLGASNRIEAVVHAARCGLLDG